MGGRDPEALTGEPTPALREWARDRRARRLAWLAIGTAPLGPLQIGALASILGVSAAFGLSGVALVVLAAAGAYCVPRLRNF